MRYENAYDVSRGQPNYYPMTYVHPSGEETKFDLQQVRYEDGRTPQYVISESPDNQGPGFENPQALYGASYQGAHAALALNHPDVNPDVDRAMRPNKINLYQQLPDGSFNHVSYREIGQDGRPSTDVERQQNEGTPFPSDQSGQDGPPVITESQRDPIGRSDLEEKMDAPLRAPEETLQQREASLEEQWRELSGPAIDRAAEKAIIEGNPVIYAEGAEQPLQIENLPRWIEYTPQEPEPSQQRQIDYVPPMLIDYQPQALESEPEIQAEQATEPEQSPQTTHNELAREAAQSEQAYPERPAEQEAESDPAAQAPPEEPEPQVTEPDPAPQAEAAEQALAAQQAEQAQQAAQRAQEQSHQMNQHDQQQYQSQQF